MSDIGMPSPQVSMAPTGGAPGQVKRGTALAVIASVDSATTPKYATVLVQNKFPGESGYLIPPGIGPFAAGGTQGFHFFYNNQNGVGGTIVLVDLDRRAILNATTNVSQSAPTPYYSAVSDHKHSGSPNADGFINPTPVNLGGNESQGNLPYPSNSIPIQGAINSGGNIIATEFPGQLLFMTSGPNGGWYEQTVAALEDTHGFVIGAGFWLWMDWTSRCIDTNQNWGPTLFDSLGNYYWSSAVGGAGNLIRYQATATTTTAGFTVPASGASATISVSSATNLANGQTISVVCTSGNRVYGTITNISGTSITWTCTQVVSTDVGTTAASGSVVGGSTSLATLSANGMNTFYSATDLGQTLTFDVKDGQSGGIYNYLETYSHIVSNGYASGVSLNYTPGSATLYGAALQQINSYVPHYVTSLSSGITLPANGATVSISVVDPTEFNLNGYIFIPTANGGWTGQITGNANANPLTVTGIWTHPATDVLSAIAAGTEVIYTDDNSLTAPTLTAPTLRAAAQELLYNNGVITTQTPAGGSLSTYPSVGDLAVIALGTSEPSHTLTLSNGWQLCNSVYSSTTNRFRFIYKIWTAADVAAQPYTVYSCGDGLTSGIATMYIIEAGTFDDTNPFPQQTSIYPASPSSAPFQIALPAPPDGRPTLTLAACWSTYNGGTAIPVSGYDEVTHSLTMGVQYVGGTTWRTVFIADNVLLVDYTDSSSPFSGAVYSGFTANSPDVIFHKDFDWKGGSTTTTANLINMPSSVFTSGPTVSSGSILGYITSSSGATNGSTYEETFEVTFGQWPSGQNPPVWFKRWIYYTRPTGLSGNGTTGRNNAAQNNEINPSLSNPGNQAFGYTTPLICTGLGTGQGYDIGFSIVDISNNESQIVWPSWATGSSTACPQLPIPPGVNNGNQNLIPDSGFKAANYNQNGIDGFVHNKIALTDPYWSTANFNTDTPFVQNFYRGSNGIGNNAPSTGSRSSTQIAISSPIPVVPGITYTISCWSNLQNCSGGPAYIALIDSTSAQASASSFTLLSGTQTSLPNNPGKDTQTSFSWTCPSGGATTSVQFIVNMSGIAVTAPGYQYWGQPMMTVGTSATGYSEGPASPSGGTTTTQSIKIVPAGATLDSAASAPTLTSGAGAPSGAAPVGSEYINTSGSTLGNIKYVNLTGLSTGWTAELGGAGVALSGLTDVNVTEGSAIDGYVLTWNNASSKWIANPAASGGSGGSGGGSGSLAGYTNFDPLIIAGTIGSSIPAPTNYYPMNETSGTTVVDAMGSANGTYHGSVLFQQGQLIPDGKPCVGFLNGAGGYAIVHDPTTSSTSFTLMVATRSMSPLVNSGIMSSYDGTYPPPGIDLYYDASSNFGCWLSQNNYQGLAFPGTGTNLLVVTYNSSTSTEVVYCNGQPIKTVTSATYSKGSLGWGIGANPNGSNYASALFGKVAIWGSTCLTAAQVTALTNAFFATSTANPLWLSTARSLGATHAWLLNESVKTGTATDSIGSDNATYYNTPTAGTLWGRQAGTLFNGSTQYVAMPHNELPSTGPFSVECSFAQVASIGSYASIVSASTSGSNNGMELGVNANQQGGFLGTNGSYNMQTWQAPGQGSGHLVMTYDGTSLFTTYLNGIPIATATYSSWSPGTVAMNIARRGATANYYGNYVIANVATYATALTAAQVGQLYNTLL